MKPRCAKCEKAEEDGKAVEDGSNDCAKGGDDGKKADTRGCAARKEDSQKDAFDKCGNGTPEPKCMSCEKKKDAPTGMRACCGCEGTLPQKAFLKYDNRHYHQICKTCEQQRKEQ